MLNLRVRGQLHFHNKKKKAHAETGSNVNSMYSTYKGKNCVPSAADDGGYAIRIRGDHIACWLLVRGPKTRQAGKDGCTVYAGITLKCGVPVVCI